MSKISVTKSSGNVYADLGLPDAKEHAVKAKLVMGLMRIMKDENLSQTAAAQRIGFISQGDLSKILRGHFRGYSVEKLMTALTKLGHDVTIEVTPASRKTGTLRVAVDA